MTLSSHSPNHVLIALPNEKTVQIPVKLLMSTKIIETTVIIDYGATANFINCDLLTLAKFPLQLIKQLIKAHHVDGTTNSKGNIEWETNIQVQFSIH